MIQIPIAYLMRVTTGITDGVLNAGALNTVAYQVIQYVTLVLFSTVLALEPVTCIFTVVINCEL
jgi:hypothetical protein